MHCIYVICIHARGAIIVCCCAGEWYCKEVLSLGKASPTQKCKIIRLLSVSSCRILLSTK
jgi:hypothetical protein